MGGSMSSSVEGSKVTRYDKVKDDAQESEYYETIYALLSARSTLFRDQFSRRLCDRLEALKDPDPSG
ncbi:hypothetical protein X801_07157 [Opisthorchis viverrini]|uniref:GSKIP domain-containing protein n=1 Tax=Opisthorchis viverrini TaxID=6198 RepID=A0A1S8WRB0_OPIVI|nr:hypothetical protein X801_07157 [Opisthorchis viverrini]